MHESNGPAERAEPLGRAARRIEHWIGHNENHLRAYQEFAEQLAGQDARACAEEIRVLVDLTRRSTECLRRALAAVPESAIL